ncbi:Uncharacterized protein dnm_007310 [Desulfonema magnum]|uniref:Uncharacterized protein n=1 Tax=Desulfonema magnum TaxID=45655 RepID=A0A975GKH9_9BACT|nr:Uncharacterized protein dnm_007310 [Desulfonema magnum]
MCRLRKEGEEHHQAKKQQKVIFLNGPGVKCQALGNIVKVLF